MQYTHKYVCKSNLLFKAKDSEHLEPGRVGKMARLRALTALAEVLGLLYSTLFCALRTPGVYMEHMHTCREYSCTLIKINTFFKKKRKKKKKFLNQVKLWLVSLHLSSLAVPPPYLLPSCISRHCSQCQAHSSEQITSSIPGPRQMKCPMNNSSRAQ